MTLPSRDSTLRLVGTYGRLRARLKEEIAKPGLVLPNGEFFPDHFDGTGPSAQRLLVRMQQHAGIADIPIRLVIGEGEQAAKQCSSGGCGPSLNNPTDAEPRLLPHADGWSLRLEAGETAHPVGLTTLLAQALGLVFLEETRADGQRLPDPLPVHQELAAVLLGFGVLLLEGSHVYSKGCGGPKITRLTTLDTSELALALALFAADHGYPLKAALRACSATQRDELEASSALLRGNPPLLKWLRSANLEDADPPLQLGPPKRPFLGGLFDRSPTPRDELDDLEAVLSRQLTAPGHNRSDGRRTSHKPAVPDDDIKALVAEALHK